MFPFLADDVLCGALLPGPERDTPDKPGVNLAILCKGHPCDLKEPANLDLWAQPRQPPGSYLSDYVSPPSTAVSSQHPHRRKSWRSAIALEVKHNFHSAIEMFVVTIITSLLLVFPSLVISQLVLESGSQLSLLQYGSAQSTQTFLLSVSADETLTAVTLISQNSEVLTSHDILFSEVSPGLYNISVNLFFDGQPGEVNYSVEAITLSANGAENRPRVATMHSVYGVVFYEVINGDRKMISGDESEGIEYTSFTTRESAPRVFQAVAHAPPGISLKGKPFIRSARGTGENPLLLESGVEVSGNEMSLSLSPYRTGSVVVTIEFADLEINGELYETVVRISVPDVPSPPVVISQKGELVAEVSPNGTAEFKLDVYNAADFPAMKAVIGDSVFKATREGSEFFDFDQKVRFVGSIDEGIFPLKIRVTRDGEAASDAVLFDNDLSVEFVRSSADKVLGNGSPVGVGTNVGLIAGLSVLGLALLAVAVGGVLAIFSSRRREEAQAQAESLEAPEDIGGFGIARDVYGRGSV
ncbi:unnamed protein product [Agarophyton chilense]|eukprot:gb/GEZJ01001791.1/.p1 GENE.gb/GEZJ01001791.1/~~gb/GEZJ01001791.1/.p1  ORF type:complete len:527 (-),score=59.48 gb/GEZJ01001791.1/:1203-2783(-)